MSKQLYVVGWKSKTTGVEGTLQVGRTIEETRYICDKFNTERGKVTFYPVPIEQTKWYKK